MIQVIKEENYDVDRTKLSRRASSSILNIRGKVFLDGFPQLDKELCNIHMYRDKGENNCEEKEDKNYRKIICIFLQINIDKPSKIYLHSFYNYLTLNMQRLKKRVPEEYEKAFAFIKGGGHIFLCYLLNDLLKRKLIDLDNEISLNASGFIEDSGKEMEGLVGYYKKLSFTPVNPESLKDDIDSEFVPMQTTVKKFLETCDDSKINEKFKKSLYQNFE